MNLPPLTPAQEQAEIHTYALASGGRCGCDRCNAPLPANRREARDRVFRTAPFTDDVARGLVPTLRARTVRGSR